MKRGDKEVTARSLVHGDAGTVNTKLSQTQRERVDFGGATSWGRSQEQNDFDEAGLTVALNSPLFGGPRDSTAEVKRVVYYRYAGDTT